MTGMQERIRRDGRAVEGASLLRRYAGNRIEGSNPSLSATFLGLLVIYVRDFYHLKYIEYVLA